MVGQASDPVPGCYLVSQSGVINDLPKKIRSSVRLFPDCVLYRNMKSPMDCLLLQDDMNSLAQWKSKILAYEI